VKHSTTTTHRRVISVDVSHWDGKFIIPFLFSQNYIKWPSLLYMHKDELRRDTASYVHITAYSIFLLEKLIVAQLANKFPILNPVYILTLSFFNAHFNIILPCTPAFQKWSLPSRFPTKLLCEFFIDVIRATCPTNLTLDLIFMMIFDEKKVLVLYLTNKIPVPTKNSHKTM